METTTQSAIERKLELMDEFEADGMRCGAINESDCHRTPEQTAWSVRHVNTLYQLWLAGRRAGKAEFIANAREHV